MGGRGAHVFNRKLSNCIKNLHLWNKRRLNGSLAGAIKRKEEEVSKLLDMEFDQSLEEMIKGEAELEDLLQEEDQAY